MNANINPTNINFNGYNSFITTSKNEAKSLIKNSKSIEEAVDIFERFAEDSRQKHFNDLSKLTRLFQTSGAIIDVSLLTAGVLAGMPSLIFLGAGLGLCSVLLTGKILIPMQKQYIDKNVVDNYYQSVIDRGFDDINEVKTNPGLKKEYLKHKKQTQTDLMNWLDSYYTNTTKEDYEKFREYIMNHYDEYCWNALIPYCLRYSDGISDDSRKARFDNFIKLKDMSESVYYMWHNSYIGAIGCDLDRENDELYKMFEKQHPNKCFCDYLMNNWRKDKNGTITDEEVNNFRKFAKMGPHQAFPFLDICHNQDGYLAWDVAEDFEYASVEIDDALYNENISKEDREYLQYDILNSMVENSYNDKGIVDIDKFMSLHSKIKNELDTLGIKNSTTLKQILDSNTRTSLGMFDDDIESIEDAINKPNRLFDMLNENIPIIKFIQKHDCSPSEVFGLLYKLTTTEEGKSRIIEEFASNPRIGQVIKDLLLQKLGGDKKAEKYFNTWFYDEQNGYRKVYKDYYKHELYENAPDLMTLVKQSPNIGTWAFKQKAKSLGVKLVLGIIPKDFGTENDFKCILDELKKLEKTRKNAPEITVNGKKYNISKINSGHSAKVKYIIEPAMQNAKKYVIKFSPYNVIGNTDRSRKFNDSFMLRGDSPYLDALIDFYLKENNCPNAPDIKYFDYHEKAVLYEMTIGKELTLGDMDFYNAYLLNNSDKLKDVRDLGVLINDINYKNILETPDGNLVIVDTGHAGYSSPFRPMVQGLNISLSNLCGRELS